VYREAVGDDVESPARKVDYCLQFLREEFDGADAEWLRGPDELIAGSPEGRHLIEVQHTYGDPLPGLLEGIVEETGCVIVGTIEQYRSVLDCVETGIWIVPTEVAGEYSRERMDRETEAWQRGDHLQEGTTVPEARRHALKTTGYFLAVVAVAVYSQTSAFAEGLAVLGGPGETVAWAWSWLVLGIALLGGFAVVHGWGVFAKTWWLQRGR